MTPQTSFTVLVPLVSLLGLIVPLVMLMMYLVRKRDQGHMERMRAIEMGYPLPPSDFWPALTALTIGAGVPLGACLMALITTMNAQDNSDIVEPAWIVAGIIGGCGVLGGTILASILFATRRRSTTQMPTNAHRKPAFDPEAFEPIGHR